MTAAYTVTTTAPRPDLLDPATPGEHVWTALALFRVTPDTLDHTAATGGPGYPVLLDRENLATVEVGCFVCEAPYRPATARTRCPGEPR